MEEVKEQSWWREMNLEDLYRKKLPTLIKEGKINEDNINKYIVPYFGNDYNMLNKDIDRNIFLLSKIQTNEYGEKYEFIRKLIKQNLIKQVDILSKIVEDGNIIDYPKDFIPEINNNFEIIFVRHGVACHNVLAKEHRHIIETEYFDPELTRIGIERSKELAPILINKIKMYFEKNPFTIIASSLIRTQQTAYYMLASHIKKAINVAPHIAERSMSSSNMPLSKDEQLKFIESIEPDMINYLKKGKDQSQIENIHTKAYPEMFYHWANLNTDFFEKGSDGIYRAVVFTHGGNLDTMFKIGADNNDLVHVFINNNNYKKPPFDFTRIKPLTNEYDDCPNNCRISYCK